MMLYCLFLNAQTAEEIKLKIALIEVQIECLKFEKTFLELKLESKTLNKNQATSLSMFNEKNSRYETIRFAISDSLNYATAVLTDKDNKIIKEIQYTNGSDINLTEINGSISIQLFTPNKTRINIINKKQLTIL
jgi:hypothetical protein